MRVPGLAGHGHRRVGVAVDPAAEDHAAVLREVRLDVCAASGEAQAQRGSAPNRLHASLPAGSRDGKAVRADETG